MAESLYLGEIRGVRIGVNWSLLPVFVLITWTLADTALPAAAPGHTPGAYVAFAVATAAAFYASLLAHELAHALVARRHGVKVRGIVLWVLGGVAQLEGDSPNARAELEIAAAGPATSFGLAAVGAIAAGLLSAAGAGSLLVGAVAWLAGINVLLAVFNLLPAFPLDGGRILRALLWRHWGDGVRATAIAARVGKTLGFALIAVGGLQLLSGGVLGGVWLALIGWFITAAAGQQRQQLGRGGELRVADVMVRQPLVIPAEATVAEAIEQYVRPSRFSAYPVVDSGGHITGLATVQRIAELPRASWRTSQIGAAVAAPPEIVQCGPQDRLEDVARRMRNSRDRRAIVVEGAQVVGILTPSDISRAALFYEPASAPGADDRGRRADDAAERPNSGWDRRAGGPEQPPNRAAGLRPV